MSMDKDLPQPTSSKYYPSTHSDDIYVKGTFIMARQINIVVSNQLESQYIPKTLLLAWNFME